LNNYEKKENRPAKEGHVVRVKIFYMEVTIVPIFDTFHAAYGVPCKTACQQMLPPATVN